MIGEEKDRDCGKCVWRNEFGCTVWDCEYLSRETLYQILKDNPELRRGCYEGA